MESKDILKVVTFGGFSMSWNGNVICGGAKAADSQFTRLMQIMIHNRKTGVDRMQLQNLLFEDSKAEDVHHLLRTTIYKARKRLEKAGLPKSSYFEFINGRYYWTSGIKVDEDSTRFEELYLAAGNEDEPLRRGRLFLEACYLCAGDFLPQQTSLSWVAQEDRNYKAMFSRCVEEAASGLRALNNWPELENLGRHAARVCPLNEWELLTMEALTLTGKCRKARELYDKTGEYYQNELGAEASVAMISKLREFAGRFEPPVRRPELIKEYLEEPASEIKGGFFCSYYMFRGIYRLISRSMDRIERSAYLAVCSVTGKAANGKDIAPDEDHPNETTERARRIICGSVRRSDVICEYGRNTILILFIDQTSDGCGVVMERIKRNVEEREGDIFMEYRIESVAAA